MNKRKQKEFEKIQKLVPNEFVRRYIEIEDQIVLKGQGGQKKFQDKEIIFLASATDEQLLALVYQIRKDFGDSWDNENIADLEMYWNMRSRFQMALQIVPESLPDRDWFLARSKEINLRIFEHEHLSEKLKNNPEKFRESIDKFEGGYRA